MKFPLNRGGQSPAGQRAMRALRESLFAFSLQLILLIRNLPPAPSIMRRATRMPEGHCQLILIDHRKPTSGRRG
jgi:hypothetical protein